MIMSRDSLAIVWQIIAMSSSTAERILKHEYPLKDQPREHAHNRKSMLIGKLPNSRKWVSYDKQRNNGDLAWYGKDDNFSKSCILTSFMNSSTVRV